MKTKKKKIWSNISKILTLVIVAIVGLIEPGTAFGGAPVENTSATRALALKDMLNSIQGEADEPPRIYKTQEGYLRFIGASPSTHFAVDGTGPPEQIADAFLEQQRNLFVSDSSAVGFNTTRVKNTDDRTYVRYQQTYDGLKVYGAEMIVQVNAAGGIACVISDIMRDTEALDTGEVSLSLDESVLIGHTLNAVGKGHLN